MSLESRQGLIRTGLIGVNIQGSRSPAIHMMEARMNGLNLSYELFDLGLIAGGPASLLPVFASVQQEGFSGVNVTFPFKQKILSLLDDVAEDVAALGACNTVALHGGRAIGYNTDWIGFSENFRRGLPGAKIDQVVVIGAGGAASAVAYALVKMGAARVTVCTRELKRGQAFADRFSEIGTTQFRAVDQSDLSLDEENGIINCSQVGMYGHAGMPISADLLRPDLWVSDVVYMPLDTALLRAAKALGCRTLGGGGMVVFQAAEAFRIFTSVAPDRTRMLERFETEVLSEQKQR